MSPPDARFVEEPLPAYREYPAMEMIERANGLLADMRRRRTVRDFDPRPVPRAVIEACLRAAGTAPSGANQQPWRSKSEAFYCRFLFLQANGLQSHLQLAPHPAHEHGTQQHQRRADR